MTRRDLSGPVDDVESQSRDHNASDGFSEQSSTLPSYKDVVGDTPALNAVKSKGGDGNLPQSDHPTALLACSEVTFIGHEEEQVNVRGTGFGTTGASRSKDEPMERKADLKRRLFCGRTILVVYSLMGCLLFFHMFLGKHQTALHTPPSGSDFENESSWPSPREIRVHERSGAIHGIYPLYDLLDLSTDTGAIHATIEPKSGNKTAVVRITSKTGAIHVRFAEPAFSHLENEIQKNEVLERVYKTEIHSLTGQIHADVLHGGTGGETVISTTTGALHLRITPIADQVSRIDTSTITGLSKIVVDNPMRGTVLKNLTAFHRSTSTGMLDVSYPSEWEGRVHAWCKGTGRVDVHGEGLARQGSSTDVYAWRGRDAPGHGKLVEVVSEGTGMVSFKV